MHVKHGVIAMIGITPYMEVVVSDKSHVIKYREQLSRSNWAMYDQGSKNKYQSQDTVLIHFKEISVYFACGHMIGQGERSSAFSQTSDIQRNISQKFAEASMEPPG